MFGETLLLAVFLDGIRACRLSKVITLPDLGGPHPIYSRPELNKKLSKLK